MGSQGPDISELRQLYLISKSASPTTEELLLPSLPYGIHSSSGQMLGTRHTGLAVTGPGASGGTGWRTVLSLGQMRFFGGPEIGFPRAAASIVNLLSVLRSLRLSGRAQPLLNSNVSLPFLSVLTGRGGYSLGGSAGARSWKCWPEASVTRIGACRGGSSTTSGRAGREAAAVTGLHLALDGALSRPPVLVEHWAESALLSSIGKGEGHPSRNPVEFPFLPWVNFCAINIFPFPFWIQNLVQVRWSWANPSHESIYGFWSRCPGSPVTTV